MTASVLQEAQATSTTSVNTISVTLPSPVTAGSTLHVIATQGSGSAVTYSWSDNNGGSFVATMDSLWDATAGQGIAHSYAANHAAGSTTVTVNFSGSSFSMGIWVREIAGVTTSPLNGHTSGQANSATALTINPSNASQPALISGLGSAQISQTPTATTGTQDVQGWTYGGAQNFAVSSHQRITTTGSQTVSFGTASADDLLAVAAIFTESIPAAVVPKIQAAPQFDTSRAAGFGVVIAAVVAAPHSSVLRPITIFPQADPTQPSAQVYDPAFNPNVVSTLALSQSGAPPQDDPGQYYGRVYRAVVTPPAVSGILGRFIFASQADPTQITPQLTVARPTPPPGMLGARIFVPFQSVDLTLQSVYMEPWHGPQGPVPPYRFAAQADPTQIQPLDVMAAPILPVIHGPSVRPVQFTPAQFDITINGTKYWTPSTFSPGAQGILRMPSLIGLNYYMALEVLQDAGIYIPLPVYAFSPSSISVQWARSTLPGGLVIGQSVPTGIAVSPGQPITLTISEFPFGSVIDSPPDWKQIS